MFIFEIQKNLSNIFDFIVSYFNLQPIELLNSWIKNGTGYPSYLLSQDTEKITYQIDDDHLSESEKAVFLFFFNDLLKTDQNIWFESHMREFCIQKLSEIRNEISGNGKIDITRRKCSIIDLSNLSKIQRELYDFIRANGRCQDNGAYHYVYYHSKKIKDISGFDMYAESDPAIVRQWRDEFKKGRYSQIDADRHHFPSTALDWYYKYLLSKK